MSRGDIVDVLVQEVDKARGRIGLKLVHKHEDGRLVEPEELIERAKSAPPRPPEEERPAPRRRSRPRRPRPRPASRPRLGEHLRGGASRPSFLWRQLWTSTSAGLPSGGGFRSQRRRGGWGFLAADVQRAQPLDVERPFGRSVPPPQQCLEPCQAELVVAVVVEVVVDGAADERRLGQTLSGRAPCELVVRAGPPGKSACASRCMSHTPAMRPLRELGLSNLNRHDLKEAFEALEVARVARVQREGPRRAPWLR